MATLSAGSFYREYFIDGPRYEVLAALRKAVAAGWVFWTVRYDRHVDSWQTLAFLGSSFVLLSSVQFADDFALRRTLGVSSRRGLAQALVVQYGLGAISLALLGVVFWRGWGRF